MNVMLIFDKSTVCGNRQLLLLFYEKLVVVGGETCQNPGDYNDVV